MIPRILLFWFQIVTVLVLRKCEGLPRSVVAGGTLTFLASSTGGAGTEIGGGGAGILSTGGGTGISMGGGIGIGSFMGGSGALIGGGIGTSIGGGTGAGTEAGGSGTEILGGSGTDSARTKGTVSGCATTLVVDR